MTIDIKATIRAAVDILTREADSLRECHARARDPDGWNGEEDAKAAYDHELSIARGLADIPAIIDTQAAEIARLREALLWTAGALQMACAVDVIMGEADGISINNETRTVAQILDAADAALQEKSND